MDAFTLKQHSRPFGVGLSDTIKNKLRTNALEKSVFYDISHATRLLPQLDPSLAVHPELEILDFYKDYRGFGIDIHDYTPESSDTQYRRERERSDGDRKPNTLENILKNFHAGQISFVGQAGSGKTTSLKAITRDIIKGKYENLRDIEVVHFVHLRSFRRNQMVTPAELLFRSVTPEMSDEEMKKAMNYAKENPNKVIFVLDSLDTIPYTIDGVYTSVSLDDRCSPEAILYHLLSGSLLSGCRFITSSREYAIRNYKGDLRAKQVIALAGLTKESMENIVVGYLGEEAAKEIMTYLETKPVVESLCATPVWLIFTLIALRTKSEFKPNTMAGILVVLLQSMIRSEHTHVKNIEVVVNKLGMMAFTGTTEHRVEFSNTELPCFGLGEREIADLVVMTPSGRYQNIILGDTILIFVHQCLQEILTAFYVTKMKFDAFKKFIREFIHTPPFAVVRRFLAGVLLNEDVFKELENLLDEDVDIEEKKVFLKKSIEEAMRAEPREKAPDLRTKFYGYVDSKRDIFELYLTLSEAGATMKDIIKKNVHDISPRANMISPSDGFSIGWVMTQTIILKRLQLARCKPTSAALSALYNTVKDSNIQLHELDVSANRGLGIDEMSMLGKIVTHCKVSIFRIKTVVPGPNALQAFLDSSLGVKLHELDVSDNDFMGETDTMSVLGKIVACCNVRIFRIKTIIPNQTPMQAFLHSSIGVKLHELDISDIGKRCSSSTYRIAEFIKQRTVDKLTMRSCGITSSGLQLFLQHSVGLKLNELDVSELRNDPKEENWLSWIAKIVAHCGVNILRIQASGLDVERLTTFLNSSVGVKLQELDLSGNVKLGPDEMHVVAQIIKKCQVKLLRVKRCRLSLNALESFLDSSSGIKVMALDLRGNSEVFADGGRLFGSLIKQCGVEEIYILMQHIYPLDKEHFGHALDNRKVCTVKIVHDKPWKMTAGQVKTLCKLLPFVKNEIDLSGCWIREKLKEKLQRELDAENEKGLRIKYGQNPPYITMQCRTPNVGPNIALNRTAEINDGDIYVSWMYSGHNSDVRYRVETFCDDHPIAEVQIAKKPFYRTNVLPPSDVCCFRISVVSPDGPIGCGMFTNEIITKNNISKHFEDEITVSGGTITIADCRVIFRPGTFTSNTRVSGKLEIHRWKWPANYTGITPMLHIHPENDLLVPAVLEMKSWCASSRSKEGENTMVHALHYCEDFKSWEVISKLPLNNESILRFECQKFSPVQGAFRDDQRGQERYLIDSHIYMSPNMPEFALASHLRSELLRASLDAEMTGCGFRPKRHFNPIYVILNENIQVVLSCPSSPGFSFYPTGTLNFIIDQDFIHNRCCQATMLLEKNSEIEKDVIKRPLKMQGHIEKDGHIVHDVVPFYHIWKELTQTKRRPAGPSREAGQNDSSDESDSGPRRKKTKTVATAFQITGNPTVNIHGSVDVRASGPTISTVEKEDQPSTSGLATPNTADPALEFVRGSLSTSQEHTTQQPAHGNLHHTDGSPFRYAVGQSTPHFARLQEDGAQQGEIRTHPAMQIQQQENNHEEIFPVTGHTVHVPPQQQHHQYEQQQLIQTPKPGQSVNVPPQEQQQQQYEQQQQTQQSQIRKIHPKKCLIRTEPEHDHYLSGGGRPALQLQGHAPQLTYGNQDGARFSNTARQPTPHFAIPGHTVDVPPQQQQHQYEQQLFIQTPMPGQAVNVPPPEQQQQQQQYELHQQAQQSQKPGQSMNVPPQEQQQYELQQQTQQSQIRQIHPQKSSIRTEHEHDHHISDETMLGAPGTSGNTLLSGVPEVLLEAEDMTIRASWAEIRGSNLETYCYNIYRDDKLCNTEPMKTRDTEVEFTQVKPSCTYQFEVWAVDSRGRETSRTWSNCAETPDTDDERWESQFRYSIL